MGDKDRPLLIGGGQIKPVLPGQINPRVFSCYAAYQRSGDLQIREDGTVPRLTCVPPTGLMARQSSGAGGMAPVVAKALGYSWLPPAQR